MGRSVLHPLCVCALGAVALVGCHEVVHTVDLTVSVTEVLSPDDVRGGPPLGGVELCETDTANCATTDAIGFAQITLPADQEISYTLSKDGYGPFLLADVTDEAFDGTTPSMRSDALLSDFSEILMIQYPWAGGSLFLRERDLMAGVTFDLTGETAQAYYLDEEGMPALDLTATTTNGRGGFVELSPGEHQVEFGGTATNCIPHLGWPGNAANRVTVPVRAGHITIVSMQCDPL